ncbi:MAG TPA: hypothetical protein GXZ28_01730 [Clostridiales bacterium]|nr:hypothetical protein [Clostridiales bacterium]
MFGYVNIYKPELKVKDYYKYKAYYCGLCRALKDRYGTIGQMTLTYDMTFLIILLSSLYESSTKSEEHRCMIHPVKKQTILRNEITEYAADMNIALTYHHFMDDWKDEKKISGLAGIGVLRKKYERIQTQYPRQCNKIIQCLNRLKEYETYNEKNLDSVSRCFGELMSELFLFRVDIWEESLRKIGFYLGKFIYIMDAYEDLEKDIKKKTYNPLIFVHESDSFEADCKNILIMMMAECTSEFEKLPCLMDIDILRNIFYLGVWNKYDTIQNEKKKGIKQSDGSI